MVSCALVTKSFFNWVAVYIDSHLLQPSKIELNVSNQGRKETFLLQTIFDNFLYFVSTECYFICERLGQAIWSNSKSDDEF